MDKVTCMKNLLSTWTGRPVEEIPGSTVCEVLMEFADVPIGGAAGGKFVVNADVAAGTADKTPAEILEAHKKGMVVDCHFVSGAGVETIAHATRITDKMCYFVADVMTGKGNECKRFQAKITPDGATVTETVYTL